MLERILLFTAFTGIAMAASSGSSREVVYTTLFSCGVGCQAPVFDKGYIFQLKNYVGAPADGYTLWTPDGRLSYQIDILAPDGTPGHVRDAAADTDGTVFVAISYGGYGGKGHVKGGGIVIVNAAGKQIQFIPTDRWLPAHLCVAPDHSIWVAGTQFAPLRDEKDHVTKTDYDLIRRYSREGNLTGEFLPRSLFPPGLSPTETGWMRAARDRIGVLTHPGMAATEPEWIELDLSGKLVGRWNLGSEIVADKDTENVIYQLGQLAFTADARLFARPYKRGLGNNRVAIFDKQTSSWISADAADRSPAQGYLLGADGNELVFARGRDRDIVTWVPLIQSH